MESIFEQDCDECEYSERSYYESDTGYSEYKCELSGFPCHGGGIANGCLMSFRYQINE